MPKLIRPLEDSHKTLGVQVQERIREAIFTGELEPGTRIDQAQLAEDLNVSIVPVREALKSLDAEGFVSIIPRRGAFVTDLSVDDMDELYAARQLIEGEVIYNAVPQMTADDIAHLHKLNALMKAATQSRDMRDVTEYIALNREFHLHIYTCLQNQYVLQVVQNLWERSELYRYRYVAVTHDTEAIHAEHMAIIEACEANNPKEARRLAVQHISNTRDGLRAYLRSRTI